MPTDPLAALDAAHAGLRPGRVAALARARELLYVRKCWQDALDVLRAALPREELYDTWVELLRHPDSTWAEYNPRTGTYDLYCVPGLDALCGDFGQPGCDAAPAGQAAPPDADPGVLRDTGIFMAGMVLGAVAVGGLVWLTPPRPAPAPRPPPREPPREASREAPGATPLADDLGWGVMDTGKYDLLFKAFGVGGEATSAPRRKRRRRGRRGRGRSTAE